MESWASYRQLFSRLNHITTFFIQHYEWSEWQQLAPHCLEDYILDTPQRLPRPLDPLLRQDYYQGIAILDPGSEKLSLSGPGLTEQRTLRKWVEELKTPELEQSRHDEILDIILANIS